MLVNSKPSLVGAVIAVKLMNGEEIIARLKSQSDEVYTLVRPVVLTLMPTGNGQGAVTFTPFAMGVDEHAEYEIERARMLFAPVEARDDAAKQYIKATTGIEIVGAGGIQL